MGDADDCAGQGSNEGEVRAVNEQFERVRAALEWVRSVEGPCGGQGHADVLDGMFRETERAEKAEALAAGFREEIEYLSRRILQLSNSLTRSNEKLRLTHRRAIESENLLRKERRTVRYEKQRARVTDHTFEPGPEFPGLCHASMFGQVCAVEVEFHELVEDGDKPVNPVAEWEDHVMEYGAPPEEHWYLSTACHHLLHDKCRLTCKFCPEPCSCTCHQSPETD